MNTCFITLSDTEYIHGITPASLDDTHKLRRITKCECTILWDRGLDSTLSNTGEQSLLLSLFIKCMDSLP